MKRDMPMVRVAYRPAFGLLVLIAAALPAQAQSWGGADNLKALMADCSRPDLPGDEIDSCLGRAIALDDSDPSPQLQALEAQLERRADAVEDGTTLTATPPPKTFSSTPDPANSVEVVAPAEAESDDLKAPDEKVGSEESSDPAERAPSMPPTESAGPDHEPPPVEDKDDEPGPPPDQVPAAPHAHVH
jgi:hypothetical protein